MSWRTIVCGAVCALAVLLALWRLPSDARSLHAVIANGRSGTALHRRLAPARTVGITDPEAIERAAQAMPEDATYTVLLGPNTPGAARSNLRWVPAFTDYWLLPRKRVGTTAEADWVLAYGASLRGLDVVRRVTVGPGIVVAELRR
jgi:hypothetical protein